MIDLAVVDLSRLQFALTALYHFLFVPLTLGLSFMLVIMESIYVMTRRPIWRTITRFWGVLFGINFVLGVATGITMEFQFGMNWSYYSHYVGDIFGAPLAIEGLMAFFMEATFVGLMFFGWDKLKPHAHLFVTFMVALGTNLSALWILIANGWMQNPVGAAFNPDTMRMEVTDFMAVLFNPVAQAKFVHTVSAGYVCASVFVLGVSAFYLLRGKHVGFAKRSMTVASAFGLAASLSVVVLGDQSGYALTDNQKMKLAALEAMWHTEPAPAGLTLVGIPSMKDRETHFGVHVPWVMGLIATRTIDKPVEGIFELVAISEDRIESGVIAFDALEKIKADPKDMSARALFETHRRDLGYGLPAETPCRRSAPGHARVDQADGMGDGAERAGPVLELPHHGRRGHVHDRPVRHSIRSVHPAQASDEVVPAACGSGHSSAVDRHRVRLDPGRVRSAALGGGRRASDLPGRVFADRAAAVGDHCRLHPALWIAGRRRGPPDPARHQEGAVPRTGDVRRAQP